MAPQVSAPLPPPSESGYCLSGARFPVRRRFRSRRHERDRPPAPHARHPTTAAGLSMSVAEWKRELDLTPEQTLQLTSILDDFARYYDNVLSDGNSRIMQILNPEQRRKFEQMLRDHKQR